MNACSIAAREEVRELADLRRTAIERAFPDYPSLLAVLDADHVELEQYTAALGGAS